MAIIYIGGIKGVGKTFALREVFNQSSLHGISYERAKVAEVMFELLKKQGIVKEYDELEIVGPRIKKDIRLKAFDRILTGGKRNVIFDGHYSIPSALGYEYGIPLEIAKEFDYLVLLSNDVEVVLERRRRDIYKEREMSFEKVRLDLIIEEAFAEFYAQVIGKELTTIKTNNEVASKLITFLKEVTKNG